MKKLSLVVASGLAAVLAVTTAPRESQGAPRSEMLLPQPIPTLSPRPFIDVLPTITDLDFQDGAPKATSVLNPFKLEIGLEARGTNPRAGAYAVKNQGVTVAKGQFALAGGEKKALPFFDPVGLKNGCDPASYDIAIEGAGFDIKKKAKVTPTCQFSSKTSNPWNLMSPDRVADRKNKHVWFNDATITKLPATNACDSKLKFATVVKNDLTHAVSGIRLDVRLGSGVVASSQPFAVGAGQTKAVSLDLVFHGDAGSYQMVLSDPQNSAGGAISSSGYSLDVTRSCSASASLVY